MATSGSRGTHANDYYSQALPEVQTQAQSSGTEQIHSQHHHASNNITSINRGGGDSMTKAVAQYTLDARLHAVFEQSGESGKSFDYSQSIRNTNQSVPEQQITAYLSKMQRGGRIQPFGCMIAVDDSSFRVLAYSDNAREMLGLTPQSVPTLERPDILTIGTDVRTLFTPSSSVLLERAFGAREITLLNPIWIHSKNSGKPFYAILHRIDVGTVIDLEPARTEDPALSIAGAVQSQKLAVRAISHLQSLPGGDIKLLCDTVVDSVRELTGYDRVMVYKFHEDEHGEVVAESKRPDLEPYIGLHYPSTDIPQASRFFFRQNRVRMIMDCHATPINVIQDEALMQPLCLVGSTLRAPHGCHAQYMANMGSIASLTLAVIINGNDEDGVRGRNSMRLWGLVVGHHTSARYIPFPLRYACEFLMQAFGLQLNMELQLASQLLEKHVLRTQTLLCDMLLRDSPTGIVTQSPSIMDLVKCDGAALYYQGNYHPLGVTPTEAQIKDIVEWLLAFHGDSTGLSTDSLADAGYPGAATLGDAVCGMAVAFITSRDFLFWFRSHTAKEIKWGGAKHHPQDKDDADTKRFIWDADAGNSNAVVPAQAGNLELQGMDELSSVAKEMVRLIETATAPIFAVGVEGRINGWNAKVAELTGLSVEEALGKSLVHDLVHKESEEIAHKLLFHALKGKEDKNVELRLKTFGTETSKKDVYLVVNACSSKDHTNNIVGVCFVGQDVTEQKVTMDKFIHIQGDYKAIVHSPNPLIPPIFASDENTYCSEWNTAMEKLTGWSRGDVIGKMLVGRYWKLLSAQGPDAMTKFMIVLHNAIGGQDTDKFPFSFLTEMIASPELQQTLTVQRQTEKKCVLKMKELAYICQELRNPLSGIQFTNSLLEATNLTEDQKQLLETTATEKQMLKIVKDVDLDGVKLEIWKLMKLEKTDFSHFPYLSLELEKAEFVLGSVIDAVVSQVMLLLRERGLQLVRDIPEEVKTLVVYGDQVRIQQILADFLRNMVHHAPSPGWVEMQLKPSLKQISDGVTVAHNEFRIICPGEGLPPQLVQDMFQSNGWVTQEGLALSMSRKFLKLMNGEVRIVFVKSASLNLLLWVEVLLVEVVLFLIFKIRILKGSGSFVPMENTTTESAPPRLNDLPPAEELLKKIQKLEIGHAQLKQEMSKLITSSTAEIMAADRHHKQRSHSISPQRAPRRRAGGGDGNVMAAWKKGSASFRHSSPLQRESRNGDAWGGGGGGGPAAVRFTDKQYLNILQAMGQAVHIFEPNCRIIYWNRTAENLYGYSAAEALGQDAIELLIDSQDFAVASNIVDRVTTGENWTGQFPVKK
ncbi:UNVERIFIED_CONTAM: Phytochrome B [Sesamum calycinum]|uniref:Phytochrome B n=1 Tax=Sesamum calycinum TaxID=2727403 RepID=A0AAW2R8U9_9LAMI